MGAVILGKEAIGEAAGWAGSEVAGLFTDNEQIKMLAGMASSFATGKVSNKVDDYFNLSRKPFLSGMFADDAMRYERFWQEVESGIDVDSRIKINNWTYTPSAELYLKYKDAKELRFLLSYVQESHISPDRHED